MPPHLIDFLPLTGYEGVSAPLRFALLLGLSTLLDGWLAHRLLFRARPGAAPSPLTLARIGRTALLLGLLFPVKVLLLWAMGFNRFGVFTTIWYDLIFVGPFCALRALLAFRRGTVVSPGAGAVAVALLAFLPFAYDARWVAPFDLRLERVEVPLSPRRAVKPPVKIAVLADLQTDRVGLYERLAINMILAQQPDIILIPGDLFQGSDRLFEKVREPLRRLLGRLHAPGGVFFTRGDVDLSPRIAPLLAGTGIRRLNNEIVTLHVRGRTVILGGIDRNFRSAEARAIIDRLDGAPDADDIRILCAHRPGVISFLPPHARIDLTIAGHTHGGQVVMPWFGPLMTLTDLPRKVAVGGLHELDGNLLYVSRGVGHERSQAPRIRFLAPPEVTLLLLDGYSHLP